MTQDASGDIQNTAMAFVDELAELVPGYAWDDLAVVGSSELPEPYSHLLNHANHMTTTLGAYHGHDVRLEVLSTQPDGERYLRVIRLVTGKTDHVVEFGVMRFDFTAASPEVRQEVEQARTPLGDILIKHNVLREIEPRCFVSLSANGKLASAAGLVASERLYGRIGRIYCEGKPAIELLEIVTETKVNDEDSTH